MSVLSSKLSLLVRHLIGPLPKGAQTVKNLPAMQETQVPSLGREDPLEIGMPNTPVFLPGESPWTKEPGGLQFMGSQRIRHD